MELISSFLPWKKEMFFSRSGNTDEIANGHCGVTLSF